MTVHSIYWLASGLFTGQQFGGPPEFVARNTPAECGAIMGSFDHLSQRVNLATRQVEDYRPDPPPDDALRAWAWDDATRRWVATPTLAALKLAARERIRAAREAAISEPKATDYGTFDATLEARSNIAAVVAMAQTAAKLGLPSNVSFTLADNTRPEFTLLQIETAALQVGAQVQTCYDHADELLQQIEAAADAAALASITW